VAGPFLRPNHLRPPQPGHHLAAPPSDSRPRRTRFTARSRLLGAPRHWTLAALRLQAPPTTRRAAAPDHRRKGGALPEPRDDPREGEGSPLPSLDLPLLTYRLPMHQRRRGGSGSIAGATVGVWHIKGTITALEWYRRHDAHLYKTDPEAQVSLRTDNRIRTFESAAQHNESKRADSAQIFKAAGTSAGDPNLISLPVQAAN
jgi:hypothetical protein